MPPLHCLRNFHSSPWRAKVSFSTISVVLADPPRFKPDSAYLQDIGSEPSRSPHRPQDARHSPDGHVKNSMDSSISSTQSIRLVPSNSTGASRHTPARTANSVPKPVTIPGEFRSDPLSGVLQVVRQTEERAAADSRIRSASRPSASTTDEIGKIFKVSDLEKSIYRRWRSGDVYTAKDLSQKEYNKWRKMQNLDFDALDATGVDILGEYKNFSMMSEYMTAMGRIKPIKTSGLRPVNQRKMAKAIRRSIGLGLVPSVHRHPELILNNMAQKSASIVKVDSRLD